MMITSGIKAQYTMGTTGMMNIPTAEMQQTGTFMICILYTSDAADERSSGDQGGGRDYSKRQNIRGQTRVV